MDGQTDGRRMHREKQSHEGSGAILICVFESENVNIYANFSTQEADSVTKVKFFTTPYEW